MDFARRNANEQPQATRPNGSQATSTAPVASGNSTKNRVSSLMGGMGSEPKWLRIIVVVLLFSGTILAIAIASLLYIGKDQEAHLVDTKKEQAVFLTNGQVYFGRILEVNDKYLNLSNIYYLNSQQQPNTAASNNTQQQTSFSLVKLGCELHGPTDQMIINREQVSFWENLKSDGKVAKAIQQFQSQNPNGQTCSDTTNSTDQSQSTNNTTTNTPANNTGTGTTKKQ